MAACPMFPLGTVLLPTLPLPLHVFEPRYREMVRHCLAGDRTFGVVLIERGSEVGGGDVRSDVGTLAEIVEAAEMPDGRWALGAVGRQRIRVIRWLDDDPYPQAEVEPWPDPVPGPELPELLTSVVLELRRTLALAAEAGLPAAPATIELSDDPLVATYQACAVAPVGPWDRQRLLRTADAVARLHLLGELVAESAETLRLALGGS